MSKTLLFQASPFSQQVLICITNNSIKHQSSIYTQLNIKTVLFQTIQLSISTQFSSIMTIDRNLSGATTPGQRRTKSYCHKGELHIPPKLPHQWNLNIRLLSIISRIRVGGGRSYPSVKMQSVYSTAPADRARGHSLRESCPFAVLQSVSSTAQSTGPQKTRWWSHTPQQRCSRCILQHQPTGPPGTHWVGVLPFCSDAVSVIYSPSRLGYRILVGGVLPLCKDGVGVFFSTNRLGMSVLMTETPNSKLYISKILTPFKNTSNDILSANLFVLFRFYKIRRFFKICLSF